MKTASLLKTLFLFTGILFINSIQAQTDSVYIGNIPGGDLDNHGCKPSAGYTWSVLKNTCIRIFEKGTRLDPAEAVKEKFLSAYVVFGSGKSKAELYIPHVDGSPIFTKSGKNKWTYNEWTLHKGQKWELLKDNVLQFIQ